METSQSLITLFETLAQVSFTVTGLMAVAVAGDSKRREYWFGHKARTLFVNICFLLLLLPGFISVGSLIPPYPTIEIPSWPFLTISLGAAYLLLVLRFLNEKKKLIDPEEFKKLEKRYSKVNSDMTRYSLWILILAFLGIIFSYTSSEVLYGLIEVLLGVTLFVILMDGAINSFALLRIDADTLLESTTTTCVAEHSVGSSQVTESGLHALAALAVAIFSFFIGLFIKRRIK